MNTILNQNFIGITFDDFQHIVLNNNVDYRIVKKDGKYYAVTQDIRLNRLNLTIENGIIINIYLG